jgi:hypothetical protein
MCEGTWENFAVLGQAKNSYSYCNALAGSETMTCLAAFLICNTAEAKEL